MQRDPRVSRTLEEEKSPRRENSLSRRSALRALGGSSAALAGILFAGNGAAAGEGRERPNGVEGSRLVTVTPVGAQPDGPRHLVSFTREHVFIRTPPPIQTAPPALGGVKMFTGTTRGVWTRLGGRRFGIEFAGLALDEEGNFLALLRGHVKLKANKDYKILDGKGTVDFTSDSGTTITSSVTTVHGTRIEIERRT